MDHLESLVPTIETQAAEFVKENPTADGRGIKIAIFDTGVDPHVAGLLKTPDGKPKIVDFIDGTGSGDVDTSITVTAVDGYITGATGRKLKVDPTWKNPSGFYHIGWKRAFDLYSRLLIRRIKAERSEKFEKAHQNFLSLINSQEFSEDGESKFEKDSKKFIGHMKKQMKGYKDPGPILDCVVFHDGTDYRAVVVHEEDTEGDMSKYTPMTDYKKEFQYARLSDADMLNYTVNIYEEGKRLSIVANGSSHGTHVAGIVSAYYPESPELNGVAPGAQLVSVKIGDTRLGTMETGKGIIRGLAHVKETGCDLVNMSYGESVSKPNHGRIIKLIHQLVNEHNVIFVASAGNEGPALNTVGAPGGTTSSVIGVGAQVSPDMMSSQYAMRENLPDNQYTWSSRGPAADGALGVDISAPGASISPVPESTLMKNHRKNGTSMSSPNACGCIALLLSYLKQKKLGWNPAFIKRALQNTAKVMPNIHPLAQGFGMLQVSDSAAYITANPYQSHENIHYKISCVRTGKPGIYLRTAEETSKVWEQPIEIAPIFTKETPNTDKVRFDKRFSIVSNRKWIKTAQFFQLSNAPNTFQVLLDPTKLTPSQIHMGEIVGYDQACPEAGPIFRIPVTVVKPTTAPVSDFELNLKPGSIRRTFVAVPNGMSYATVKVKSLEHQPASRRTLVLHTMCPHPSKSHPEVGYKKYLFLNEGLEVEHHVPVTGGSTLEVCLAQNWNNLGSTRVRVSINLFGANAPTSAIAMSDSITPIDLFGVQNESLELKNNFGVASRMLRPSSHKLTCSNSARDLLFNGNYCHDLVLKYKMTLEANASVLLELPHISKYMYDNVYDSFMIHVHDKQKKLVTTFDYKSGYCKMTKGTYNVRVHLRHDDLALLQRKTNVLVKMSRELPNKITSTCYSSVTNAIRRANKINRISIAKGQLARIYVTPPSITKLKFLEPGWTLHGTFTATAVTANPTPLVYVVPPKVIKDDKKSSKNKDADNSDKTTMEQLEEEILLKRVSFASSIAKKKDKAEDFEKILSQLLESHPDHLKVLELKLTHLNNQSKKNTQAILDCCDHIANVVPRDKVAIFFGTLPKNIDEDDKELEAEKAKMTEIKKSLVNAYYQKLLIIIATIEKLKAKIKKRYEASKKAATADTNGSSSSSSSEDQKEEEEEDDDDLLQPTEENTSSGADDDSEKKAESSTPTKRKVSPKRKLRYYKKMMKATWKLLIQQADTTQPSYIVGHVKYYWLNELVGEALQALSKVRTDKAGEDIDAELAEIQLSIYKEMHIDCWVDHIKRWNIVNKPKNYALF